MCLNGVVVRGIGTLGWIAWSRREFWEAEVDRQKCKTYDGALRAGYYASLIAWAAARLSSDESVDGRRGYESVSSEDEEERDYSGSEAHLARTDCIWQVLKGDVDGVKVSRLFDEGEQAKPKAFFLYAQQFNNGANMDEHGPASMFSIGSADGPTVRLSSRVETATISALISTKTYSAEQTRSATVMLIDLDNTEPPSSGMAAGLCCGCQLTRFNRR
jgi:hypothetical protein